MSRIVPLAATLRTVGGSTPDAPNKPAAPNAGIASRLTIEHPWPGVPERTL